MEQDVIAFALGADGKPLGASIEDGKSLWRHLDGNDANDLGWLNRQSGLDPIIVGALTAQETRPRYAFVDPGALLICRGVNLNPDADLEDMVSLRLWCDGEQLISVALRPVMAVNELRKTVESGRGALKATDLFLRLADLLTMRIRETVRSLEDTTDALEDKFLETERGGYADELRAIRRRTIWLKRFIDPQSDALQDLLRQPPKWLAKPQLARAREITDATLRAAENLGAVREHSALLQDHLRVAGEESTKRMTYLLTLVAGVFLPLNLLAGLLGANVGGIPGADSPWGFVVLVTAIAAIGVTGAFFLTRIK